MKTLAIICLLTTGALSALAADGHPGRACCCAKSEPTAAAAASLTDKSLYQLDGSWTNDAGAALTLAALRGRPQIVTMFFANCAYACPLLVYQMQQVEAALPAALRDKVGFTLVTFDTQRDTVAALHNYREGHGLAASRWTLLRGSADEVQDLAALLNVKYKQDSQGQFQHSNVISLLNAEGEVVYQQLGLTADNHEMIRRATALAEKSATAE